MSPWTWNHGRPVGGLEGGTKVHGAIVIVGYMPKTERKGQKSSDLSVFVTFQLQPALHIALKEPNTSYNWQRIPML